MNCLARYFAQSFENAVEVSCKNFGECFRNKTVYFGKINHKFVTIEEFIPKTFVNNNGQSCMDTLLIFKYKRRLSSILHMRNPTAK